MFSPQLTHLPAQLVSRHLPSVLPVMLSQVAVADLSQAARELERRVSRPRRVSLAAVDFDLLAAVVMIMPRRFLTNRRAPQRASVMAELSGRVLPLETKFPLLRLGGEPPVWPTHSLAA